MIRVLGIDVASSAWPSNGSALLGFETGQREFAELVVPAIVWPNVPLTPDALASSIDLYARANRISAVSLDGPQGWRDPLTPSGSAGVGRRCEFECRTQGKAGVCGQTYPGTQREWFKFSMAVFDHLLTHDDVALARKDANRLPPASGYILLESLPTAARRTGFRSQK